MNTKDQPTGNPEASIQPLTCGPSLYARTKLTRGGITIFKRYEGVDADYYFRPTMGRQRIMRKLLRTADKSFRAARQIMDAINAGRFDVLDQSKARQTRYATLEELFTRYSERARFVSGIQKASITSAINALRNIVRHVEFPAASKEERAKKLPNSVLDKKSTIILNRELLENYKRIALAGAGQDRLKQRTASITANATIRQARSLFARGLGCNFYEGLILPDFKAFKSVSYFKIEKRRYKMPEPEMVEKIRAGARLLKQTDPAAYIVYLLGMGTGLRKNEIAHARVRWIEPTLGASASSASIRVQTECDFHIKDNEERTVPLDGVVLCELAEYLAGRDPESYVIPGNRTARTDKVFRRVGAWLKALGWTRRLKTHEFRKMFGSIACQQAGVRAAQVLLGHASLTTTEDIYVDPAGSIAKVEVFKT